MLDLCDLVLVAIVVLARHTSFEVAMACEKSCINDGDYGAVRAVEPAVPELICTNERELPEGATTRGALDIVEG